MKLGTLDEYLAVGRTKLFDDHLEMGLYATGITHRGSRFVEDALGTLGLSTCTHE